MHFTVELLYEVFGISCINCIATPLVVNVRLWVLLRCLKLVNVSVELNCICQIPLVALEPSYFREEGYCSLDMEGTGRVAGLGLELLNQSNYRIWKTCMESYLVGEDLWDVVSTNGVVAPTNIIENAEAFKKWKQQNAKT
ncbi:hypothetical protein ZIOFF_013618 [Zingiber officinale]|uniref:DUF4219 domain-containing protein n=1 Tax=Zingiber officinale TaxID=94328 RepID=A0A8J5LNY5_ZINOF|nr:hypothetical protein ZIOFF_013618 [Zingiber officinale]